MRRILIVNNDELVRRAIIHPLKGTSGLPGFGKLEIVGHVVEIPFCKLRDGVLPINAETSKLCPRRWFAHPTYKAAGQDPAIQSQSCRGRGGGGAHFHRFAHRPDGGEP